MATRQDRDQVVLNLGPAYDSLAPTYGQAATPAPGFGEYASLSLDDRSGGGGYEVSSTDDGPANPPAHPLSANPVYQQPDQPGGPPDTTPVYGSLAPTYGQAATPTPGFGEYTMHAVDDFDGEDDESNVTVVMESSA